MTLDADAVVAIKSGCRLQWEDMQDSYVLLYPEGMVRLDPVASDIMRRCAPGISVSALIAGLEQEYEGAGLADDVRDFLRHATESGWISVRQHS